MKFFEVLAIFLGTIFFSFVVGASIGAYVTDFCLPNGCGYEAGGTIGFFAGIIPGILLAFFWWKNINLKTP